MIFSIADFKVEFNGTFGWVDVVCRDYISEGAPEINLKVTEADMQLVRAQVEEEMSDGAAEVMAFHKNLGDIMPTKGAFVLHSALFDVEGTGIAFAAHSGTGKTTHMKLWGEMLGNRLKIVNGDKPIIRFFENEPDKAYAYGNPWNGKEGFGCNMKTQLKHICFIERAEENSCERMKGEDAVNLLFNQVYMPSNPQSMLATINLINKLIKSCELWVIKCNTDISAAETAYRAIFGTEANK